MESRRTHDSSNKRKEKIMFLSERKELWGVGSNKMLVEILEIRKYENRLSENFSLFFDI